MPGQAYQVRHDGFRNLVARLIACKVVFHIMKSRFIKIGNQQGLSLVELVASLVIAGILAVALSTIVVTAMDGYLFSQNSADVSQKGQLALARMRNELLNATAVSTATGSKIVFTNPDGTYELEKTGSVITLKRTSGTPVGPKILVDNILVNYGGTDQLFTYLKVPSSGTWSAGEDIALLYAIDITLKFDDNSTVFNTTVNPRANRLRVAPRML
jgi:prepilin-type N-terminal cleavage/methylation domain-containing protein